jgi:hypothetical protein
MIVVNLGMALVIGSIPLVASLGHLSVWWIYGASFVNQTLFIFSTQRSLRPSPAWWAAMTW